jgi:hypothetical protein
MKTAKVLGMTIPQSLLLRADQAMESVTAWKIDSLAHRRRHPVASRYSNR